MSSCLVSTRKCNTSLNTFAARSSHFFFVYATHVAWIHFHLEASSRAQAFSDVGRSKWHFVNFVSTQRTRYQNWYQTHTHTHTKTSEPLHQTLNPRNIDKLVVSLKNLLVASPQAGRPTTSPHEFRLHTPCSVSQQRIGTLIVQHIVQGFIVNLGESTNSVVRFFLLPRFDDNSATQKGEHKGCFFFATSPDQNRTPPTTPTPTRTPRPTISTVEPGNPGYQPCQAQQGGH